MFKKPWVKPTLIALLALLVLTAAGYGAYRLGYMRGALAANDGVPFHPFSGRSFADLDDPTQTMLLQDRRNIMFQEYAPGRFPASKASRLGAFTSPFLILLRLVIFVGVLWVLHRIAHTKFQGSGWKLNFTKTPDSSIPPVDESNDQ